MEYFSSLLLERALLNPGSTKKTYHLSLSTGDSSLAFQPGDSIGILPSNAPSLVSQILEWLKISPSLPICDPKTGQSLSIETFLSTKANLSKITTKLRQALHLESAPAELDIETALSLASPQSLSPQQLISYFLPLMPRFYSIASSRLVHPHEIHLLVAFLQYPIGGTFKAGVGSHFLCELAKPLITHIPIYVQPAKSFRLPQDPKTPIILIGPGTGVAPFRAFLQERLASKHPGKNWLFFGERNRAFDFYYKDFWDELVHQKRLRLDTAFSRDTEEKCYVQHRIWNLREEIWDWMEQGAIIYVCGDASQMAKEVEATFVRLFMEKKHLDEAGARALFKAFRHEGRYLADVY